MLLHIFRKIWIVNFASSHRLPELHAGTVRKREDTVFVIHGNLEMLQRRIIKFLNGTTNLFCNIVTLKNAQESTNCNSLEFNRACEDLCWNHDMSTTYRSGTNGIAESAVRGVNEGTAAFLVW